MRSITRQEKAHSLSYQERTFTAAPSTTLVNGASTMEEWGLPRKSLETSSACETARIPLRLPLAAFSKAWFTSAAVTLLSSQAVKSVQETFGGGTRPEIPSSRPSSSGSTLVTAMAAPGVVGFIIRAGD